MSTACDRLKMTFTARPSTYRLSKAPTARGCCRKCRNLIPKGATRVEICAFVRPGRRTVLLRCSDCIDPAFASAVLAVYKRAERVPADATLGEAEERRVREAITTAVSKQQ